MESGHRDRAIRLREIYERFAAGDPRPLAEFLADDVVYHLPGKHLGGGTIRGRLSVLQRTASAAASCEAPPVIRLIDVMACADFVVSTERLLARRRGATLDQEVCVVWRIVDEQCVELWSHFADQDACDRFWS